MSVGGVLYGVACPLSNLLLAHAEVAQDMGHVDRLGVRVEDRAILIDHMEGVVGNIIHPPAHIRNEHGSSVSASPAYVYLGRASGQNQAPAGENEFVF